MISLLLSSNISKSYLLHLELFSLSSLFIYFSFNCSSTVVSIFPHHSPQPPPSAPPTLNPTPLWLCLCVFYTCSSMTLLPFALIISSHLPSGDCQFILNFSVSGYIFLACWLGSTYRWDHMVFVCHRLDKNQPFLSNHSSFQWKMAGKTVWARVTQQCWVCHCWEASSVDIRKYFWKMKYYICNLEVRHLPFCLKCDFSISVDIWGQVILCCWGAVLGIVVCLAASLASTQQIPVTHSPYPTPRYDNKIVPNIVRCPLGCGSGQIIPSGDPLD